MTIESYYTPQTSNINGAQEYPFTFEFIGLDRIFVYELDSAGNPTLVDPSDYSLVPGGSAPLYDGGQVNFNRAHGAGINRVRIERRTEPLQEVVYSTYNSFPSKVVELTLDKLTMLVQELSDTTQDGVVEEAPYNSVLYGRYNGQWVEVAGGGGGGGEINTASNLAGGQGVFAQKVGFDLQFKSLVAGTGISLSSTANTITITNTGGGGGGAYLPLDGSAEMTGSIIMANGAPDLQFKQGLSSGLKWGAAGEAAEIRRVAGSVLPILQVWERDGEGVHLVVGDAAIANWRFRAAGKQGLVAMQMPEVSNIEWMNQGTDTLVSTLSRDIQGDLRLQNLTGDKTIINAGGTGAVTLELNNSTGRVISSRPLEFTRNDDGILFTNGFNSSILANNGVMTISAVALNVNDSISTYSFFTGNLNITRTTGAANITLKSSDSDSYLNLDAGSGATDFGSVRFLQAGVLKAEIRQNTNVDGVGSDGIEQRVGGVTRFYVTDAGSAWLQGQTSFGINQQVVNIGIGDARYTLASDSRLKENVRALPFGLNEIMNLRPVAFDFSDRAKHTLANNRQHGRMGLLAQEVKNVLPNVVFERGIADGTDDIFLGVDYNDIIPVLIRAVQELTDRVAALEA